MSPTNIIKTNCCIEVTRGIFAHTILSVRAQDLDARFLQVLVDTISLTVYLSYTQTLVLVDPSHYVLLVCGQVIMESRYE